MIIRRLIAFGFDFSIMVIISILVINFSLSSNFIEENNYETIIYLLKKWCLIIALLFLLKDSIKQQSIGKWIMGIYTTNLNHHNKNTLLISIKRNLSLILLPIEIIGLFKKQRLGDIWAQTRVISKSNSANMKLRIFVGIWIYFLFLSSSLAASVVYINTCDPIIGEVIHSKEQSDTFKIKSHLKNITKRHGFRTFENTLLLDSIADYIFNEFKLYADTVYFQEYMVNGLKYKNVIGAFNVKNLKTIVVGAHYDVCGNQDGADDNASGVVGLLELARLLKNKTLNYNIELVAYTLEEPPYFRTENMGSYVHAKSLKDSKRNIYGMVSLEMIGYFKDDKNSQDYPAGILSLIYGNKGDYITLVNKFGKSQFESQFSSKFKQTKAIKTKSFTGPKTLAGIDFSDHLNYWKFGFSALMITDTAFNRNKNYHEETDTMETLDFNRMAKVINGVLDTLISL